MKRIWKFAKFQFVQDEHIIKTPDGELHLRPKVAEFLLMLLEHATEVVPRETLISQLWRGSVTADDGDLRNVKSELVRKLGVTSIIENIPGAGYRLAVPAEGIDKATPAIPLDIFPGAAPVHGRYYVHSWAGHGSNDQVKFAQELTRFDPAERSMVLLDARYPSTLRIPFKHTLLPAAPKGSWWAVAIPLRVVPKTGRWEFVDVGRFEILEFEARADLLGRKKVKAPILLKVRLEDDATSGAAGSFRQSTNWHPKPIKLIRHFRKFRLTLDDFDWSASSWASNTEPPNRAEIVQIIFGQDHGVPSCHGVIEITNVRLLPVGHYELARGNS